MSAFAHKMLDQTKSIHSLRPSVQQIKKTAQVFYKKLVAGDAYQPHAQAKSNVVLFKATDTSAKLSEDYGLAEVCVETKPEWYCDMHNI